MGPTSFRVERLIIVNFLSKGQNFMTFMIENCFFDLIDPKMSPKQFIIVRRVVLVTTWPNLKISFRNEDILNAGKKT